MSRISVRGRILAAVGAAILAVAGVVVPMATSAQAAPGAGTYSVVNRGSNLCLDVLNFSTADNAGLIQYACAGTTNQRFTLTAQGSGYRITAGHSGKCLGVQDNSSSAGKAVVQQTCNGSASQTWTFSDASNGTRIINGNGAKCVNTRDNSTASNAVIQQNSCDNVVTKHWTFTPSSGPQPTPTITPTVGPTPTPTPTPTVGPPPGGLVGWATQGGGTTGGGSSSATTVTDSSGLSSALSGTTARVVRVSGTISCSGMISVGSNKSVIGNSGAVIQGCGLNVSNASNVIIRNLTFRNWNDDGINVQYSTRVWIDHNTLSNGYDGAIDIKRASDYVTVSWNRIYDHDKSMLLGHDDGNGSEDRGHLRVTYHHNWFDGTGQRHPRVRFGNPVHVYNNYYGGVSSYGVASTEGAGVLVEGNYFENTEDPYHLGEGDSGPGTLVARNNHFVNSGAGQAGGSVASIPYSYSLETASNVKSSVTSGAGAGRISV
ncbi:pectate lyase family protein [Herbidospora mongoliensis]|uniref:pectate lyase family protein n=1 Tax=Herbidospora mongoliensis TaxID=688067 RepID=UPI000AB0BCD7|nr:RICIN domain-containing protein [Herbidospora mongoliensis]